MASMDSLEGYWNNLKQAALSMGLSLPDNDPTIYIVNKRHQEAVAAMDGGPHRYKYWSFGRDADFFRRGKRIYSCDLMALGKESRLFMPYGLPLGGQIVFLAYFIALNDFVAHNRVWSSLPENAWDLSRANSELISKYGDDDEIGYERVRNTLAAAHAMRYQCSHSALWGNKACDLLEETIASAEIEEWQKDILRIVHEEWKWLLPRKETKLMMAGYASFFAMRIIEASNVNDDVFEQCRLTFEEMVAFPSMGELNLQQIGYEIFEVVDRDYGREALFRARENTHDVVFVAQFLNMKIAQSCGLFSWSPAPGDEYQDKYQMAERIRIRDISDESGWKKVRNELIGRLGYASHLPVRIVRTPDTQGRLVMNHVFQGKVLEPKILQDALRLMYSLWKIPIELSIAFKEGTIRYSYDRKNGFRMRTF